MKKFTPEEKKKLDDFDGSMYGDPSTWGQTVGEYLAAQPGPMESTLDAVQGKKKSKKEIMDGAYARGQFNKGEVDFSQRLSDDYLLEEIKKHNDVHYKNGKYVDNSGQEYTLEEAAKQNYQNFKRHKSVGFKKVSNANNRSRDLMKEQRKFLGYGPNQDTLKAQSVNSQPSQESFQQENRQENDIKTIIEKRAAIRIQKEDEAFKKRYGTRGIPMLLYFGD